MALNDDQGWVTQFETMLRVQHAQQGSVLKNLLDPINVKSGISGHICEFNRTAPVVAPDMVNPSALVVPLNPLRSIRAAVLVETHAPVHVYEHDKVRSLVDPTNTYTKLMLEALGRRVDTHLINAAVGSAMTVAVTSGTGVRTYGSQALPAAQTIGSGAALVLLDVYAASEKLTAAGNPVGPGNRTWLYAPGNERDIMSITQASSSDFTRHRIHDTGTVNGIDWEGFNWLLMPDVVDYDMTALQRLLPLSGTTRSNVIFCKSALGYASGMEIKTDMDPLPGLQGRPMQISPKMNGGAVRIFDYGVVVLNVLDNLA